MVRLILYIVPQAQLAYSMVRLAFHHVNLAPEVLTVQASTLKLYVLKDLIVQLVLLRQPIAQQVLSVELQDFILHPSVKYVLLEAFAEQVLEIQHAARLGNINHRQALLNVSFVKLDMLAHQLE